MNPIASEIKKLRKNRGWTLDNLSEMSGFTPTALSKIELGKQMPRPKTYAKIMDALKGKQEPGVKITTEEPIPEVAVFMRAILRIEAKIDALLAGIHGEQNV